jgi:hypothetical protein
MSRSGSSDKAILKATDNTLASRTKTAFLVWRRHEYTTSHSVSSNEVNKYDPDAKETNPNVTAVLNHAIPSKM